MADSEISDVQMMLEQARSAVDRFDRFFRDAGMDADVGAAAIRVLRYELPVVLCMLGLPALPDGQEEGTAPTTHELKVWAMYGDGLDSGEKTFEFRRDDREPRFAPGDVLHLREWDQARGVYLSREWHRRVTYTARNGIVPEGYCVMSIVPVGDPSTATPPLPPEESEAAPAETLTDEEWREVAADLPTLAADFEDAARDAAQFPTHAAHCRRLADLHRRAAVALPSLLRSSPVVETATSGITLKLFQDVNWSRAIRWAEGSTRPWSLLEVAGELCGEAGEAANFAKKILRHDIGMAGNATCDNPESERAAMVAKLGVEIADVLIVAVRLASECGVDLESVVAEKFDRTSAKMGFPERLSSQPVVQRAGTPDDVELAPAGTLLATFQAERTAALSEMFDNRRGDDIYPTSRLFARLDASVRHIIAAVAATPSLSGNSPALVLRCRECGWNAGDDAKLGEACRGCPTGFYTMVPVDSGEVGS